MANQTINAFLTEVTESGASISGKCQKYDTYQDMLNDKTPPPYALVIDASADVTLEGNKSGVMYRWTGTEWEYLYKQSGIDDKDYTAFEVYAHDTKINTGDLSSQSHANFIGKPGDIIAFGVNPSMTESFILRSEQSQDEQDVIVDWGDGNTTKVSTITPQVLSNGAEYRFTVSHTYSTTGVYIVKIFGHTYFSFTSSGSDTTSLISRIFEPDLPIARHIWNLSSVLQHSHRLLHVNMYSHAAAYQIKHWSGGFTSARNLIDCIGFTKYAHRQSNYNLFQNCTNLVETDFRIADAPADKSTGNAYTFTNCPKLAVDINSILPTCGFKDGSVINVARLFKNCPSLTGTIPANMLWNNTKITWQNTSEVFLDCSEEIRSQVPVSWGGTASDDIIEKSDKERIAELEARLIALESN